MNVAAEAGTSVFLECSAFLPGTVAGDIELVGDQVNADPELCAPRPCGDAPSEDGDYELSSSSPCLAAQSPCGDRIGAFGEGCDVVPVLGRTWGGIKAAFR